jgi:hypothetical protein
MRAVVIIFSILAFIACLLIGIQAGSSSLHPQASSATDTPNPWLSPSEQRTILVIVADDLSQPNPALESVWLALYRPDLPKLTFLPLFPESPAGDTPSSPDLAGAFSLEKKQPSASFMKKLAAYQVHWNGYLLTDEFTVAQSIDWMQGIELSGSQISGQTAMDTLVSPALDRTAALTSQKTLVGALCKRISHLPLEANWVGLANTFSGSHLQTNLQVETLVADWKAMMTAPNSYICDIP